MNKMIEYERSQTNLFGNNFNAYHLINSENTVGKGQKLPDNLSFPIDIKDDGFRIYGVSLMKQENRQLIIFLEADYQAVNKNKSKPFRNVDNNFTNKEIRFEINVSS